LTVPDFRLTSLFGSFDVVPVSNRFGLFDAIPEPLLAVIQKPSTMTRWLD
jgi:hypothetical protein